MADLKKVELIKDEFKDLLQDSSKLLFSGKFGSGKTTYINDFFTENDNYDKLHIYPVNYSIVSNTDIFELIKYDILFQLLGKIHINKFEKLDFPFELTLWHYLIGARDLDSKADFLLSFFNFAGSTGKAVLEVYDKLRILRDKYLNFQNELKIEDLEKVENYLRKPIQSNGHIYEEDFYTELIRKLIEQLKVDKKEIVLVIDDLDRLDPDHIFRILNIFSAHIDFRGEKNDNKFNFNKVILVCDYENIESVFHHRYGYEADFKGYIDKFYTNAFWFDPSSKIKDIIYDYLNLINGGDNGSLFHSYSRIGGHIEYIMNRLVDLSLITFRDLISYNKIFYTKDLFLLKSKRKRMRSTMFENYTLNSELVIYFLFVFFGGNKTALMKIIDKAKQVKDDRSIDNNDFSNFNKIADLLLLKENYQLNNLSNSEDESFSIIYEDLTFICQLVIKNYNIGVNCNEVRDERNEDLHYHLGLRYFEFLENGIINFFRLYSI